MADHLLLETGTNALVQEEDGTSLFLLEQQSFAINTLRNQQAVKRASFWMVFLMLSCAKW